MRLVVGTGFLISLMSLSGPADAQPQTQEFRISPATSPIVIDGQLDEPAWQHTAPIPIRYENFPGDNAPAQVETVCFVTFDPSRLYNGCRASDPNVA